MTPSNLRTRTTVASPYAGLPPAVSLAVLGFFTAVPFAAAFGGAGWLAAPLAVPPLLMVGFWAHGRLLLVAAALRLRPRGVRGVLVHSESPAWRAHVQEAWLPRLGARVLALDGPARAASPRPLEVRLYERFCRIEGRDVDPAVIVLRGLRHPLVFRFHAPLQAARQGDRRPLEALERELFQAMGDAA
jgi:hypothetical protein